MSNPEADAAATEAIGWNALCDNFSLAAIRLELQLLETRHRCVIVEEEASHRVFFYNSLMFGITGQTARLARHFSTLMDDVNAMQNNHDRMQAEKSERVHQIQEYHAQMILEHRSQAEAQAASFANKIETLRSDERDLRLRVSSLRQEAEESYAMLEKRRNDSLEERRQLEMDLQRLQGEVGNQKYFLERLNAQVESSKMRMRENERAAAEVVSAAAGLGGEIHSRRISPPADNNNNSNTISQADRFSMPSGRMSPSPQRHTDSIASGISHVQAVRDLGVDEQFVKYGRTAGTGSSQRAVHALNNSSSSSYGATTPRPVSSTPLSAGSSSVQQVGLGSSYRYGASTPSNTGAAAAAAGRSSPPPPMSASRNGGTPGSRGGVVFDQTNPSQWQIRLMKLQGELKSLKTDLGVQSPVNQQHQQQRGMN